MKQRGFATVQLGVGLAFALSIWGLVASAAAPQESSGLVPVQVSLALVTPTSLAVQGEVVLRGENSAVLRVPVASTAPLSLNLPAASTWEVSADLPGFWVARKQLTVGPPDQASRISLALWPLGRIAGTVKAQGKGVSRPRQLLVKTLATPAFLKRPSAPPGALDCPVDEKGAWSCSLPAATFDIVISADGLTPKYLWAVEVPAGKTLSLGTIELERGASLAGWVAVEAGAIQEGRCLARLSPLVAEGADLRGYADLQRIKVERAVSRDGFFQLTGLKPGVYVLEVSQPGYAPAKLASVRVDREAETFLRDPLVLVRPLDLAFEITPPLDWLGKVWRAQVFRIRDAGARIAPTVFDGRADADGRFTVAAQSPGAYRIAVLDSLGNRLYWDDDRRIDAASGPQDIQIKLVDLEGRVRLGREPLTGSLSFGGRSGAMSVKLETDEEGQFSGVLPREGLWFVDVESTEPRLQIRIKTEVHAKRSGKARVDIDLPDTRVFGRVLDEEGRPASAARVVVQGKSPEQWLSCDAKGEFDFRGLLAGPAQLIGTSAASTSAVADISLVEGSAVGPIELRLRKLKKLAGSVVSSRGPVVGSRVLVAGFPPVAGGRQATTDSEGRFAVDLPEGLPRVMAIVMAPGYALRAYGPMDTPLALAVSEAGGNLEVTLPADAGNVLEELSLVLFQNGLPLPVGLVRQWAVDQGQPNSGGRSFLVPHVAPGEYRVCLVPRQLEPALVSGAATAAAVCDSGLLAAGASLSLAPGKTSSSP